MESKDDAGDEARVKFVRAGKCRSSAGVTLAGTLPGGGVGRVTAPADEVLAFDEEDLRRGRHGFRVYCPGGELRLIPSYFARHFEEVAG